MYVASAHIKIISLTIFIIMINPSHDLLKVGVRVKGVQENEHSIKYCFIVLLKYCKNVMVHAKEGGMGGGGQLSPHSWSC